MSVSHFPLSLDATIGASYLGTIAASIFFGITSVQTFLYFKRSSGDSLTLKCLIVILWILDGVHLAFIVHAVYTYAVTNFSNLAALGQPLWCITGHVLISSLSDLIVRGLFCQRVWKLSRRNRVMTTAIVLISLLVFASGLAFSIWGYLNTDYFFDLSSLSAFLYTNFVSGVVADILIATFLCIFLARQRTNFAGTESLVRGLMLYSINTGVLTSLFALLCLLLFAALPVYSKFAFIAIYFVLPKLLLNSFLATLNARQSLRQTANSIAITEHHGKLAESSYVEETDSQHSQASERQLVEITVETVTVVNMDTHIDTLEEGDRVWTPLAMYEKAGSASGLK